eukprot:15467233-Alexandrium_andersonii.AAC.1
MNCVVRLPELRMVVERRAFWNREGGESQWADHASEQHISRPSDPCDSYRARGHSHCSRLVAGLGFAQDE